MTKINKLLHYISTTRKFTFAVSVTGIIGGITGGLVVIILIIRFIVKLFSGSSTNIDNELPSLKPSELSQDIDNQPKISTTKSNPGLSTSSSSTKHLNNNLQTKPAIIQSNGRIETPLSHIQPNLGQGSSVPPGSDENPQGVPPPPGAPPLPPQEQHNEQQNINPPPVIQQQPPPPQHQLNIVNVINPNIAEQVCDERGNVIIPKIDFSEADDVDIKTTSFKGKIKRYVNNQLIDEIEKNNNNIIIGKKHNNGDVRIFINGNKYMTTSQGKAILLNHQNQLVYDGDFNDDYQYHGEGTLWYNGDIIKGTFNNGRITKGEIFYNNNNHFEGNFDGVNDNPSALYKFGAANHDSLRIRRSCIFQPEPDEPNKGTLYSVTSDNFRGQKTLFYKGTFYEDDLDNNQLPYPRKGVFYHPNGKKKFEGTYYPESNTYEGTLYSINETKQFNGIFDKYFNIKTGKKYNQQGNLVFAGTFFSDGSYKKGIRYNGDSPDENLATKIDNEEVYFLKKHNLKITEIQPPENIHIQENEIYGKVEYNNNSYAEGIFKNGNFVDVEYVSPTTKSKGKYFKENNIKYFKGVVETNDQKIEGLFTVLDNGVLKNYKNNITNKNTNEKYLIIEEYRIYEIKDKNGNTIDNVDNIRNDEVYDVKSGSLGSTNQPKDTYFYYEGEMINGRRHGKGRFYTKTFNNTFGDVPNAPLPLNNTDIKMEGTFFNGTLHGKGKRINDNYNEEGFFELDTLINGTIIFRDGTYSKLNLEPRMFTSEQNNAKINGTVEEYNKNGRLIQTIEYKDNIATIKTPNNETIFNGEYNYITKTRVNGTGKEYKKNEDGTYDENFLVFDGEYKNRTRMGIMKNPSSSLLTKLFGKKSKKIKTNVDTSLNSSFFKKYKQQ